MNNLLKNVGIWLVIGLVVLTVVKQFDSYEVEPGLHQKGQLIVGESVADLGGLTIDSTAILAPYLSLACSRIALNFEQCSQVTCMKSTTRIFPIRAPRA